MENKNTETGAMKATENAPLKTALVAIIGRPSAGKSTFLNTACQEDVSIVSPIPQTTRNAIKGIVNTSFGQLIFIDTPGYHVSEKKLNLRLKSVTEEQLEGVDCVLYIIDSTRPLGEEELHAAELIKKYETKTVVAINKSDSPMSKPMPVRAFIAEQLPNIPAERIFEMSAEKDIGINEVLKALYDISPVGAPMYDEETYTDQDLTFRVCEIIRGEAINRLKDEIPHAVYVQVADIEHRNEGKKLWIRAFLCVERESQKGIVIGKGASKIKEIRTAAAQKLSEIYIQKIDLDLQVKVDKNWRPSAGSTVKTSGIGKTTHLAIAARSSVTAKASCVAVELPKGIIRDALNLVDHPDLIGSRIYLKGDLVEAYFGTTGLKATSEYILK